MRTMCCNRYKNMKRSNGALLFMMANSNEIDSAIKDNAGRSPEDGRTLM